MVRARVTVESLDLSEVNSLLVSDSTNARGIVKLATGFVGGGLSGETEFEYDKGKKGWVVSSMDEGLLDAYFGIR